MDVLEKYIKKRKWQNTEFAHSFEAGYENFRIGILLRRARKEAGMTQEQLAGLLKTQKSAISRIENHAEDIRFSTLESYVDAFGKKLHLSIFWFFSELIHRFPSSPLFLLDVSVHFDYINLIKAPVSIFLRDCT